jgi:hypothetical protein
VHNLPGDACRHRCCSHAAGVIHPSSLPPCYPHTSHVLIQHRYEYSPSPSSLPPPCCPLSSSSSLPSVCWNVWLSSLELDPATCASAISLSPATLVIEPIHMNTIVSFIEQQNGMPQIAATHRHARAGFSLRPTYFAYGCKHMDRMVVQPVGYGSNASH